MQTQNDADPGQCIDTSDSDSPASKCMSTIQSDCPDRAIACSPRTMMILLHGGNTCIHAHQQATATVVLLRAATQAYSLTSIATAEVIFSLFVFQGVMLSVSVKRMQNRHSISHHLTRMFVYSRLMTICAEYARFIINSNRTCSSTNFEYET